MAEVKRKHVVEVELNDTEVVMSLVDRSLRQEPADETWSYYGISFGQPDENGRRSATLQFVVEKH